MSIETKNGELKAPIFQTIHGSFVDGYGCRTTIFLKGCPLRCKWCCNPESQRVYPEVKYNKDNICTGCGRCVEVCPAGALEVVKKAAVVKGSDKAGEAEGEEARSGNCNVCPPLPSAGHNEAPINTVEEWDVVIDREKCTHCGKCGDVCRTDKLEIYGKDYTVDEIFEEIRRDEKHYDSTGGGVTIGGGECTMHGEFTLALIRKCKEHYIQTALDTCGYITDEAGLQAFDEADYVLLDIKGLDPERHKENTGVDNEMILQNLRRRNEMGKPVIIRYPLIPGFNDDELPAVAEMLSHYPVVERVDIIPYHDYSKVKYEALGMEYQIDEPAAILSPEEEEAILDIFRKYGLKAQIGG